LSIAHDASRRSIFFIIPEITVRWKDVFREVGVLDIDVDYLADCIPADGA
jgi:hypothetical protein